MACFALSKKFYVECCDGAAIIQSANQFAVSNKANTHTHTILNNTKQTDRTTEIHPNNQSDRQTDRRDGRHT